MTQKESVSVSENQKLLYLFQEKEPQNPLYNLLQAYTVKGHLDVGKFKNVCDFFYRKHSVLNSNFIQVGDSICTVSNPGNYQRYFNYSKGNDVASVLTRLEELKGGVINLKEDPILQVYLYEVATDHHILAFKIHHICADAYSLYHWLEFMSELYNRDVEIETIPSDVFMKDVQRKTTENYEKIIRQYSDQFLALQDDKDYFSVTTGIISINKGDFLARCKECNVSEFAFHLAVYSILVAIFTGDQNVCISVPFSGRSSRKSCSVFGYMVNLQPLIIDLSKLNTIGELLSSISLSILTLFRNQYSSIVEMQQSLSAQVGMHFDYSANFYKNKMSFNLNDCVIKPISFINRYSLSPFSMTLSEQDDKFNLCLEYENAGKWKNFSEFVSWKYQRLLGQITNKTQSLYGLFLMSHEEEKVNRPGFTGGPFT